jgi:hypothetical protein
VTTPWATPSPIAASRDPSPPAGHL